MPDNTDDLTKRLDSLREFLKMDRRYAFRVGHDQGAVDARILEIDEHLQTVELVAGEIRH